MRSITTKLGVTISLLIIVLFSIGTLLFIYEKKQELTQDVLTNSLSFADLTALNIAENSHLYLEQQNFIRFNQLVRELFQKTQDIENVRFVNYNQEILYDSRQEKDKQYEGNTRKEDDPDLISQIKSRNPSVKTKDTHRVVYIKKDTNGILTFLDFNEKPVKPLSKDEKIEYLVQPATNETAVIYYISYKNLQSRIAQTTWRGALVGLFGVGVGILLAIFYAGGITKPLKKLTDGARVIAKGNFSHRVEIKTKDELHILAEAFNEMAKELEISTKALVYKERVAKELELAAKIQKELLPKEIPKTPGLDISAGLIPAEEIGGDCYDFIKTDDNNLLLYLGDVTGHGVPSGIVVSIANALISSHANNPDLISLLVNVNKILKQKTSSSMFMTLVILQWNAQAQKLKYVSAGHEQMIHFHAKDKKVTLTPAGGLALGMFPDISKNLKEQEIILEKNDAVIIYSDGIPESWKDEKEMYGMARLKRSVSEYGDLPTALAIRNALLSEVKAFSDKWKQMDDITIIVIKKI